jgi:hypothetical protein
MPTINPGDVLPQASDWNQFSVNVFGKDLVKLESFEINYSADVVLNQGKDGEPVSWTVKNYKREGKFEVSLAELAPLIQAAIAFGGDITKLPPMPILAKAAIAQYTYDLKIPAVKLTKFPQKFKPGDADVLVSVDFAIVSMPIITMT